MSPEAGAGPPGRPLAVSELLTMSWALLRRRPWVLIALAAIVVVPVQLIVSGVGLEQLTASYQREPSPAELVLPAIVSFLVVTPLVTAATIDVIAVSEAGETPRVRASLQASLDIFAPLFACVLLAAGGIALGLLALVLPGIYLAVRWFFVPQAFVLEGARRTDALSSSMRLTEGLWWRTFAVIVIGNLLVAIPSVIVLAPLEAIGESLDRQAVVLAGATVVNVLAAPFLAVLSTVLYWDLQVRQLR